MRRIQQLKDLEVGKSLTFTATRTTTLDKEIEAVERDLDCKFTVEYLINSQIVTKIR